MAKFGTNAVFGMPPSIKFDQVKLPKQNIIAPKMVNWNIVSLIMLVPGTGLLILLKSVYFCTQYIIIKPKIANNEIIGCNETKKQVNKNKLTISEYSTPISNSKY